MNTFTSDAALSDRGLDRFGRWPFAKRVVESIRGRIDPSSLVIGIYGEWGSGKTSVLNFIEQALKENETIPVRFNPWLFPDQNQLIKSFFETLAEALGRHLKGRKEAIGSLLSKYAVLIPGIKVTGVGGIDIGKSVEALGTTLSSSSILDDRKKFEQILQEEKKQVLVLIDDIDRLDKSEIQALFKLVKLTADFQYVHYILAFDDRMVAEALGVQYGDSVEAGRRFLEKIVQVPLHLPMADQFSLRQFTFDAVDLALTSAGVEVNEEEGQRFVATFNRKLQIGIRTPRMAKTYANALSFSIPILKGEVNVVDLMLIEGVRVIYPKLYVAMRDHKDLFLGSLLHLERNKEEVVRRSQTVVNEALKELPPEQVLGAKGVATALFPLLMLDPQRLELVSENEGQWAKAKRICSEEYFDRYFSFAIPLHDISDEAVDSLIALAEGSSSISEVKTKLIEAASQGRAEAFLAKLERKTKTLNSIASEKLSVALGKSGKYFDMPRHHGLLHFGPLSDAAKLTAELIENIREPERRIAAANSVIKEAEPLYFADECLSWMRGGKDQPEDSRPFTNGQYEALGKTLAERIKCAHANEPLYTGFPKHAARLLLVWARGGGRSETNSALSAAIERNPAVAIQIIKLFRARWFVGHRQEFRLDTQQYGYLRDVVDPEKIALALTKVFDSKTLNKPGDEFEDEPVHEDEIVARQFMKIYRVVAAESL